MDWPVFIVFLLATGAAASTGAIFKPGGWYESLNKPIWTPPNWMFPVVWTTLYILSAYAAMRVAGAPGTAMAMAFWAMQIAFNTLWSPIFFGLRNMKAAMVAMVGLWVAVFGTFVTFWQVDTIAGLAFAPYVLWVTVAGMLNWTVLRMNPSERPVALG